MLQKSYLKYELASTAGVIASVGSDICFSRGGKRILSGALEAVNIFSAKSGNLVDRLAHEEVSIVRICESPDGETIAVGYSDGSIRIWGADDRELISVFTGHTKSVTCLAFSSDGALLASGSQSTEVLVWDVLGQAGKMRLKSHKSAITCLHFTDKDQTLITGSKDSLVLVWDLSLQACTQTLTGHRHEVWSILVDETQRRLITGSADNKLRIWKMDDPEKYEYYGAVNRSTELRAIGLGWLDESTFAVLAAGKDVEIFSRNEEPIRQKKMKRRLKREKDKMEKKLAELDQQVGVPGFNLEEAKGQLLAGYEAKPKATDEYTPVFSFKADHKLAAFATHGRKIAAISNRNEIQVWKVGKKEAKPRLHIERTGHRSDIRSISLDSTDSNVFSSSQSEGKIWSGSLSQTLATVQLSGTGLCSVWLPLDKHIVVGTKEGKLDIVQTSTNSVLETINAHQGAVWDIKVLPNGKGLATASADKTVKFWDFSLRKEKKSEASLTLTQTRVLSLNDDVLSVCFSPDGRLVAAALLDSTIKVHFVDSFKLFLTLYGHALPVLSIDISSDSNLLISASADKNVKIWGLDFGDCHRSLKAHEDSVTKVAFIAKTHYFISSSKDGTLKYWDADSFEQVLVLRAHQGEVWSFAISRVGDFLVSGSHDRSLRRWDQTEELVYPETERKKEMDRLFAPAPHELISATSKTPGELKATESGLAGLEGEISTASLPTLTSYKHAEKLADAVERAFDHAALIQDWETACRAAEANLTDDDRALKRRKNDPILPPPEKDPLLLGLSPEGFLAHVFKAIPLGELESCLSLLGFTDAFQFLAFCSKWLSMESSDAPSTELVCRATFFLIRLHLRELSFAPKYRNLLLQLRDRCRKSLEALRSTIAFNSAGITHLQRQLKADSSAAEFFQAAKLAREENVKRAQKEKTRKIIY